MRGYFGIGVEGISKPMKLGNLLRANPTFRRRQRTFSAAVYILLGVAAALSGLG